MKKSIYNDDVYYTIAWSQLYNYDKHSASRILPELSGILCLLENVPNGEARPLLFYGCWREGLRYGLKVFMDLQFSKFPKLARNIQGRKLLYKYTVIDTNLADMQDIMYWLIGSYEAEFNSADMLPDSKRYKNIHVKEMSMKEDQIMEKIPKFGL